MSDRIRIFIVDDHEIFRNGLKMVINKSTVARITGEASNGKEFLELYDPAYSDIVLMDIEMPVMNGIDASREILSKFPEVKIIALTMFNEDDYVQSMIDAGVQGFLIKNVTKETLEKAIRTVHDGGNYYSEELFRFFTRQLHPEPRAAQDVIKMTRREEEILQLIAKGLNNREIAEKLFVSERTVVGHKSNLLSKTGCKNTINLLSWAIKNNLVNI